MQSYVIDKEAVLRAMSEQGVDSIGQLASVMGVHRNTISAYISGQRALPAALDSLLHTLQLSPGEAIVRSVDSKQQHALAIADVMSSLLNFSSKNAFVLFGSRARGNNKKYSDYDIGVYSKGGVELAEHSQLLDIAKKFQEEQAFDINITNLNNADKNFLLEIKKDWKFLTGDFLSWVELQKKSEMVLYE